MARDATLHVKLEAALAARLKELAERKGVTVASLVRRAIASSYQLEILDLAEPQRQALEAYRGGYISVGRLAESMGLHVLAVRHWLKEHGIPENANFSGEDIQNA